MANINDKISQIRRAIFGKDVRESIASGIESINKEVENTAKNQNLLKTEFDQIVINSGSSNAEIVQARVNKEGSPYSSLKERLDKENEKNDSKFKEVAMQLTAHNRGSQLLVNTISKLVTGNRITIAGLGDSIMYGLGSTTGNVSYLDKLKTQLEAKYKVPVTLSKQAVSGYTVRDAFINNKLSNIEKDNCDLVIISFGHNDIKSDLPNYVPGIGYPLEQSLADTEHIIRRLRANNQTINIILLGESPYPVTSVESNKYLAEYTKEYKILASKYNCLFIDATPIFLEKGDYTSYIKDDGHPTDLGHDEITAEIMKYFTDVYVQSQVNFALPNDSLRKSWRYGKTTWKQITGSTPADGDRVMYNGTGWTGSPKISTKAGDFVDIIARCSCIAVKAKITSDTHILMLKDSLVVHSDTYFPSFYPVSPNYIWLTIPFNNDDSGMHSARIYLRGGSLEIDEVWCLSSPHEFIPCDNSLLTYDSNWTTIENKETKAVNYHSKFKAPTTDSEYKVTIPFVGTGLSADFNVQNGICVFEVNIDGTNVADLAVGISGAYNLASGVTICSGLSYGQHTVTLTAKTGNTVKLRIGGFLVLDERRIEEPTVQRGLCTVGTNQLFGVEYDSIPFVSISGNGTNSTYCINKSKTGFTMSGTSGEVASWEARGHRIAY